MNDHNKIRLWLRVTAVLTWAACLVGLWLWVVLDMTTAGVSLVAASTFARIAIKLLAGGYNAPR